MKKNPNNGFKKSYNKPAYQGLHKAPSPELVKVNDNLTLTINPIITPYDTKRKGERVLNLAPFLNAIIKSISKLRYCAPIIYPEISCMGKWHFHGVIKITEIINFYCFDLPLLQQIGALEIDTIKDADIWNTYIKKCQGMVEPFLKGLKLNYEINKNSKYYPEDPLLRMELEEDDEAYLRENIINDTFCTYMCPQSET